MLIIAIASLACSYALLASVCIAIRIQTPRIVRRMNAECEGMSYTANNGRRYMWMNGRLVDVQTGKRYSI